MDRIVENAGKPRLKLTPEAIEALVGKVTTFHHGTLTVAILELTNGGTVTGTSNVINPETWSAQKGREVAIANAKEKIWELEGYALKTRGH